MATFDDDGSLIGSIREFCGEDIAEKVHAAFGGRRISIPKPEKLKSNTLLVQVLGMETARHVCTEIATHCSVREIVPLAEKGLAAVARANAADLLKQGKSVRATAAEIGLHERTIFRLRKKLIQQGKLKAARRSA